MKAGICHAKSMEILGDVKEKSTLYIGVSALALMGAALVFSTWSILRQQRQAGLDHLELASAAVLQAVDSSLRRGPRMNTDRLPFDARGFFRDLESSGEVLFVGFVDEKGAHILASGEGGPSALAVPEKALAVLRRENRWHGQAAYEGKQAYIAARRIQQGPGAGMRQHHRNAHLFPNVSPSSPGAASGAFLMVVMDMEKHLAAYGTFRKTALFQTAYTLAAAAALWILAARLISRRKMAGRAAYLERFQAKLIDSFPDGLLIVAQDGAIGAANPAARAMLSKDGSPVTGRNLADLSLPPPQTDAPDERRRISLAGMQLEIRTLPIQTDDEEASFMVVVHDRTRMRTLEKNLAEAEKLAAVGALAAGVAHEIRNPLSALRGFAQYFAKKLAGKQPEEEYAATMVREADRLNRVITDLLFLAKPRGLAPVQTDLASACAEMKSLLRFELQEYGAALVCDLEAQTARADPDALKQALLNLLLNSLEAVGAADGLPERTVSVSARRSEHEGVHGVWLTVADTGPGMPEASREHAFTPFFTTKNKGSGLGLALVDATMRAHGGAAIIVSGDALETGTGCAVSLFFPDARPDGREAGDAQTDGI